LKKLCNMGTVSRTARLQCATGMVYIAVILGLSWGCPAWLLSYAETSNFCKASQHCCYIKKICKEVSLGYINIFGICFVLFILFNCLLFCCVMFRTHIEHYCAFNVIFDFHNWHAEYLQWVSLNRLPCFKYTHTKRWVWYLLLVFAVLAFIPACVRARAHARERQTDIPVVWNSDVVFTAFRLWRCIWIETIAEKVLKV
jgi:hypothetical protein